MKYAYFEKRLSKRNEQRRYEQLRAVTEKTAERDFTSTDPLCLCTHDYVKKCSIKAVLHYGAGSTTERFLSKHVEYAREIETTFANAYGYEAALLFPTVHAAKQAIFPTLVTKKTTLFSENDTPLSSFEKLSHEDAHRNVVLLQSHKSDPLETKPNALTILDDTFATGLLGEQGLGFAANRCFDLAIGHMGRGAFVVTSKILREYILAFADSHALSTPLPPASLGSMAGALELVPNMNQERTHLQNLTHMATELFNTSATNAYVPLHFSHHKAVANALAEKGYYVTILDDHLQLTLTCKHTEDHLFALHKTLQSLDVLPKFNFIT